jgi:hypothetical protein
MNPTDPSIDIKPYEPPRLERIGLLSRVTQFSYNQGGNNQNGNNQGGNNQQGGNGGNP